MTEIHASGNSIAISNTGTGIVNVSTGYAVSLSYFREFAKKHKIVQTAIDRFFATVVEKNIPVGALDEALTEIARRYVRLGEELLRFEPEGDLLPLWEEALSAHSEGRVGDLTDILDEMRSKERLNVRAILQEAGRRRVSLASKSAWLADAQMIGLEYRSAVANLREALSDLPEDHPNAVQYLGTLSEAERCAGNLDHAVVAADDAIRLAERIGLRDRTLFGRAFREKGRALREVGGYDDAAGAYASALDLMEDADLRFEIEVELAGLAIDSGNLDVASDSLSELEQRADNLVPDRRVADLLYMLGRWRIERREWPAAEHTLRRALKILDGTTEANHLSRLRTARSLALALRHLGRLEQSSALYAEVLQGFEQVYGPEHPENVTLFDDMAGLEVAMGNFSRADDLYRHAIELGSRTLGKGHADVSQSWNNLGTVLQLTGQDGAVTAFQKAADGFEAALGRDHLDTATAWHNLAGALINQSRPDEAEDLLFRAKALRLRILGPSHEAVADSLALEAALLELRGKLSEAVLLQTDVLQRMSTLHGNKSLKTMQVQTKLAALLCRTGSKREALSHGRKALFKAKRHIPRNRQILALTLNDMGEILFSDGQFCRAHILLSHAVSTYSACFPDGNRELARSLINKAAVAFKAGEDTIGEEDHVRAIALCEKLWPEGDYLTAAAKFNLAQQLAARGETETSLKLRQGAISIISKLFGEEHPEYLRMSEAGLPEE